LNRCGEIEWVATIRALGMRRRGRPAAAPTRVQLPAVLGSRWDQGARAKPADDIAYHGHLRKSSFRKASYRDARYAAEKYAPVDIDVELVGTEAAAVGHIGEIIWEHADGAGAGVQDGYSEVSR